jgi:regulator of CtrA degradation
MAAMQTDSRVAITEKLIGGLYTEAMLLADEARAYFDEFGRDSRNAMTPLARVSFSCESLKVTTRLMHVVAWLLTQRAILAGREAQATPLSAAAPSDAQAIAALPGDAREIIVASADIYARVQRLEAQMASAVAPPPNPALALRQRLERAF